MDIQVTLGTQPTQPNPTVEEEQDTSASPRKLVYCRFVPMRNSMQQITLSEDMVSVVLGRHSTCDIVLQDTSVSNRHCKFYVIEPDKDHVISNLNGPTVFVEDLGSSNGTFVNGKKLSKNEKTSVVHGDEISLGSWMRGIPDESISISYILHSASHTNSQENSEYNSAAQDKYDIRHTLGTGNFSIVKLAIARDSGHHFACKIIDKRRFVSQPKVSKAFEREVAILKSCNHPNIITFIDVIDDGNTLFIIMDLVTGGDLQKYICDRTSLEEEEARNIARQICEAISYLHEQNVTHRDLKPENILMVEKTNQIKVSDFGLAKVQSHQSTLRTYCGTPAYLAPEIHSEDETVGYSNAVDCWSLGVIVYFMLTGRLPFNESTQEVMKVSIMNGHVDFQPFKEANISSNGQNFVAGLLQVDPMQRMSMKGALEHPWITREANDDNQASSGLTLYMKKNLLTSNYHPSKPRFEREITVPVIQTNRESSAEDLGSSTTTPLLHPTVPAETAETIGMNEDINTIDQTLPIDSDTIPENRSHEAIFTGSPLVLKLVDGSREGRDIVVHGHIFIGRSVTCHVSFEDTRVSSMHARLWKDAGVLWIRDTSHNGTFLNDKRVQKNKPIELRDGDVIGFIKSELDPHDFIKFIVHTNEEFVKEYLKNAPKSPASGQKHGADDEEDESEPPRTKRRIENSSPTLPDRTANPWARLLSINPAYKHALLTDNSTFLGRQVDCPEDLRYLDVRISAHHCTIFRRGRVPYIQDTSANGTIVNGKKLLRGMMHVLGEMDEIILMHDDKNRELEKAKITDRNGRPVLIGYYFQILNSE